ncbi:MAG: tripartite tricarboxylate transporter permease [Planctomycetaceae bacterium]|nr:tripartite tricarboxylate transporter permease [Planctomycetales bacterium]MCB9925256.1 tripartite tricarboxylate transporter permease [Planctomycetaceae bacterium]
MTDFAAAFEHLLTPWPMCLMLIGVVLGVMVGAIPGLTGAMLIALTLPLTYTMSDPADAMILLVSMYVGSISGGLISATLLRMPGTPASIMTTLDGHPMAANGKPGRALGLGVAASFVGGSISWLFLVLLSKPIANLSTHLGPFDFFSLTFMALMLIASVSGNSLTRGTLSGLLGVMASLPGVHPATGDPRMTLGFRELDAGFQLLPVLIGLFAVGQLVREVLRLDDHAEVTQYDSGGLLLSVRDWTTHAFNLVRSSLIGVWVGILPGVGANIGSILAYSAAKAMSKTPERFGEGSEEGIIASEAANNATVGGALIPLVALGIPGSVIDAILLGALVLHGLTPGPLLFRDNPEVVYTIMAATLVANFAMAGFMLASIRYLTKLMNAPRAYLVPVILVCCVVGSYAQNNRMFDVWVMLAFGAFGFALESIKIPLAPFVIGFILAPIAEENLGAGLQASGGSYLPILTSPISLVFCLFAAGLLIWPIFRRVRNS